MDCLEVLDRARATEVECILADPDVARIVALSLRDAGEFVFDHRALTQRLASNGCLNLLAKPEAARSPQWRPSVRGSPSNHIRPACGRSKTQVSDTSNWRNADSYT